MSITISATDPRVQYTASGGQTAFSVPFEFFADADLVVIKTSGGTDTTLSLASSPSSAAQYSVTGAGASGGGNITLGGGATVNDKYTIFRNLSISRSTDFPTSGTFPIETLNTELDKLVAMIQQKGVDIKLSPRASSSSSTAYNLIFPELVANKVLSVNSSGNAIEFSQSITDVQAVAAIASDVSAVAAIASDVAAVENIASDVSTVAADASDIGAVAGKATEIGRLGNNEIGLRPLLGAKKPYGTYRDLFNNPVPDVLGPSASQLANIGDIAWTWGTGKYNHHTARNVRRLLPFQNVWFLDSLFDEIEQKGLR